MHLHELVEGKLVSLVHARHPGGQGCLVLRVGLVAEMLEVGGGKETVLVGHRVDLLADVGGRHGGNDADIWFVSQAPKQPLPWSCRRLRVCCGLL